MIRLLVMDMNGTIASRHTSIALAEAAGKKREAERIVEMRANGDLKLGGRVSTTKLLKGLSMEKAKEVVEGIQPAEGVKELVSALKEKGVECAIVTTGYDIAAEALAKKIGVSEVHANRLMEKEGMLTGEYSKDIVTPEDKVKVVEGMRKEKGLEKNEIAVIGDSLSDTKLFDRYKAFAYRRKRILKGKGIVILNPLEILEHLDDK